MEEGSIGNQSHRSSISEDGGGSYWQHRLAAFLMPFAPNAAFSFYLASVGFYMEQFNSKIFFMAMMLCMYAPHPIIAYLKRYDDIFDERFGSQNTYYFRIVSLQAVLAVIVALWLYAAHSPISILIIGVCISTILGASSLASIQLQSTLDPRNVIYLTLGQHVSGLAPIVIFIMFSFSPSDSKVAFRNALSPLLFMCFSSVAALSYFQYSGLFKKGYARLSYTFGEIDWTSEGDDMQRQMTETEPLTPGGPYKGIPRWVWYWCGLYTVACFTCSFSLSFTSYLGDARMAQKLWLAMLAMEFIGACAIIPVPDLSCFKDGPWHAVLGSLFFIYLALTLHIFASVFWPQGVRISSSALLLEWILLHGTHSFMSCLIELTTGAYTAVAERKAMMEKQCLWRCAGGMLGVVLALCVAFSTYRMDWPDMHAVVL